MSTSYSGEVHPGGPADVRELDGLTITKFAVDEKMSNNCYLLTCRATGQRALIDAAADATRIREVLDGGSLSTVITTHQHWDHHRALAEVVAATGAHSVAGGPDADAIAEQTGVSPGPLADRDRITFGNVELEVITIVGHTPGSICLLYRDPNGTPHLFSGDSLFPGGVGATFGDSAAFATLIDDVVSKIFGALPDDTWFYPGHGNDSALGVERPHLAEWRARGW
jgi:glyoxylase-like metal-dependent hydrolase (beta-lactamase superfamily II)